MRRSALLVAGLLALMGCGQRSGTEMSKPEDMDPSHAAAGLENRPTAPQVHVSAKPNDAAVQLQVVKYQQLLDTLKGQKGKIVVVDVWATFCLPCMKEFPNLVALHKEHAKDGVVCMSVSVDDLSRKEAALKFLQAKGATFANFLLDEEAEVWQKNWMSNGVPIVFVFDRDGSQAARFVDDGDAHFTYKDVKAKVEELLRKAAD